MLLVKAALGLLCAGAAALAIYGMAATKPDVAAGFVCLCLFVCLLVCRCFALFLSRAHTTSNTQKKQSVWSAYGGVVALGANVSASVSQLVAAVDGVAATADALDALLERDVNVTGLRAHLGVSSRERRGTAAKKAGTCPSLTRTKKHPPR